MRQRVDEVDVDEEEEDEQVDQGVDEINGQDEPVDEDSSIERYLFYYHEIFFPNNRPPPYVEEPAAPLPYIEPLTVQVSPVPLLSEEVDKFKVQWAERIEKKHRTTKTTHPTTSSTRPLGCCQKAPRPK